MQLRGFELLERIAEGDLTTVWKARQISLDRVVLLKVLKPEFASSPEEVQRFVEDGRAAAALNHPHTIHLYDVGFSDGIPYYVMEYVAGPTVDERIRHGGPLPSREALSIARCVAEALQYGWERRRVIHRNVKPANIHLESGGMVKLKYLGLTWRVGSPEEPGRSRPPPIEGTPWYMAPEQVRGEALDCRTDMYGLGATLYHMVTGFAPFQELTAEAALQAQVDGQIPHPTDVVSGVSTGVAFLITRLLMKRPADRFRDWDQVLETIAKIQAGSILVARPAPEAHSTVAPPASSSSAIRRRLHGGVGRIPAGRRPIRKKEPEIPASVRWVAGSALGLWAALLGYRLWGVTPVLPRPPLELPAAAGGPKPVPSPLLSSAPAGTPVIPSGERSEGAPSFSGEEGKLLRRVAEEVVQRLLRWDAQGAEEVVRAAREEAASESLRQALEGLRAIAEGPRRADALALEWLRQRLGQPLDIAWLDGRRTRLVVRQVNAGGFTALPASGASGTRAETSVLLQEIDPAQRAAWMGEPDGPALAAAACVLYLRAGRLAQAEAQASRAGPLAEALRQAIQARKTVGGP